MQCAPGSLRRSVIILCTLTACGALVIVDTASATPHDLRDGVYISHFAPSLVFTVDTPVGGWGQALQNSEDAIDACEDQLNRIDGPAPHMMWFIISAWWEEKIWCATQVGIAGYDPAAWAFHDNGPIYPGGGAGLEIYTNNFPHGDPPGGPSGVICGPEGGSWGPANFEPVWWFEGYAYDYGTTVIQLGVDPATAFGGWFNCENPPGEFPAACFGAMGVNTDGVYCCPVPPPPEYACCFGDGSCEVLTEEDCITAGGEPDDEYSYCDPNPCPQPPEYACCFEDGSCVVTTVFICDAAGGEILYDHDSCHPNPCPQPQRVCCFEDGTCQIMTQADCTEAGGTWWEWEETCDPNPCPPPERACCFEDGACEIMTEAACALAGGMWYVGEPACDPNPCPQPPEYACCFEDGSCVVTTVHICDDAGGEVYYNYDSCDPNPCPQPIRACCFEDGSCELMLEVSCGEAGGDWDFGEETCDPNPCPQPQYACCFEDGTCQLLTEAACADASGESYTDYHTCEPNPCPQPIRACCFEDGSCELMTEAVCGNAGGEWLSVERACEPNPCRNCVYAMVTPNGGELWSAGEAYEIQWVSIERSSDYIGPNVDLLLTRDDGTSWELIVEDIVDCGSHVWTIPETYESDACRVRVRRHIMQDCFDDSDGLFTIERVLARDAGSATTAVTVEPNPANASSRVTFTVAGGVENAKISIYDVTGRCVRMLTLNGSPQGMQRVTWDGRSDRGEQLDSGIYFYQLTHRGGSQNPKRIVMLKIGG